MSGKQSDQEIIYESSETEAILDNSSSRNYAASHLENENIIQTSLNPADAFQFFHQFRTPVQGKHYYQLNTSIKNKQLGESPWEKYYRLKSELEELRGTLNEIEAVHQEQKDSVWSLLQDKTSHLLHDVEDLSSHAGWKFDHQHLQSGTKTQSHDILPVEMIRDVLDQLSNKDESSNKEQLINLIQQSVARNYSRRLLDLESKINSLEAIIGTEIADRPFDKVSLFQENQNVFPLSASVQRLEEKIALVDQNGLDQYRSKISLIKVELEGLVGLISVPDSGTQSSQVLQMYNKIQGFIDQFAAVQSTIVELPSIILRLKTLENIHWSASTFVNRLDLLEKDMQSITGDLQSNQSVLNELKAALIENFSAFQQNVGQIEEKLQK